MWSRSKVKRTDSVPFLFGKLLCLTAVALTGCQTTPLAQSSVASPRFRPPITTAIESPRQFSARCPKKIDAVALSEFSKSLWQSDEPPPLLLCESEVDVASKCECFEERPLDVFRNDLSGCWPTLWDDACGVVNWNNSLILAAAAGAAIALREGDADREVREWVAEHPRRWGDGSRVLRHFGNVEIQVPALLSLYGYSVWAQDDEMHELSGSLLSAFAITGVATSTLKVIANTDRPTDRWADGKYGFPSYHTSSSFAIAAVLDEYYGSAVGLPAFAFASAIGFSRLDEQDHQLSDVVFGGALGFVIGKAVAGRHLCGNSQIQFGPYFHPTDGTPGLCCEARF